MDIKKNIFILTGAGISKESGIQTFREKDGFGIISELKMFVQLKHSLETHSL